MDIFEPVKPVKNPKREKLYGLVVSVACRYDEVDDDGISKGFEGHLVAGSQTLIDDIREAGLGDEIGYHLGFVPAHGFWVWEGHMVTSRGYEGDYDVDYRGKYRKATLDELATISRGEPLWDWGPEEPDPLEEDGS